MSSGSRGPGHGITRSSRAFWSVALASLAVAGLYTSARAADQRSTWAAAEASTCRASTVAWGYDMELVPGAGYAIAGVHFDAVPDRCVGAEIVVSYAGADGVEHRTSRTLAAGTTDRLDPAVLASIAGPDMTASWSLAG